MADRRIVQTLVAVHQYLHSLQAVEYVNCDDGRPPRFFRLRFLIGFYDQLRQVGGQRLQRSNLRQRRMAEERRAGRDGRQDSPNAALVGGAALLRALLSNYSPRAHSVVVCFEPSLLAVVGVDRRS
uniref:Uncharacterized protein n=1 Tax=Plectus sambesii TaxID=2011161 RepID=A0A914V451_9BILA